MTIDDLRRNICELLRLPDWIAVLVDDCSANAFDEIMSGNARQRDTVILLEAAPNRAVENCDSSIFRARQRSAYLRLFADCGLRVRAISGVDPAPFKTWLWPYLPRLPQRVRTAALAVVAALSIPIDVLFGRRAVEHSWHAVFILERARGTYEC